MGNATRILKVSPVLLLVALIAVAVVMVVGGSRTVAAGRGYVDMPARVQTGGMTAEEHVQRQIGLTGRLLKDLPSPAELKQVRINLGHDEIDAIDRADKSSTPLKIGLVKAMTPAVEVNGLDRGSNQPRQGTGGEAIRTWDGGYVWALSVSSDQAGAIRLHVENLSLPRGAELYVYSRGGEVYGPYTGTGVDASGEFWTPAVFGRETLVQVKVSGPDAEALLRDVSFRIAEAGIITEKAAGGLSPMPEAPPPSFCGNPDCIVDASCYSAANSIRDAYAKEEWIQGAWIYTCTGGLLNDTNPTLSNFFLTANHCYSKNSTAKNVSFYWRFRTSSCNGSCPSNSGWPYKTTGAAVRSSNRRGDYTLVQLNAAPPSGSVFLGWTSTPVANTNGAALHRVSNPNFGPQVYNEQTVSTSAPTCSGWPRGERIYSRTTLGGTDGGSSGSPVVNASDQVVGQLSGSCGTNVGNPCDHTNNATVDGAFAYYFASVQPYLAP